MKKYLIALFGICLVMFFTPSCKVTRATGPYKTASSKKKTESKSSIPTENIRTEAFKADDSKDESRLNVYNVVIGSFSKKQNAINLKNDQQPAYNPIIVVNESGMFRVILVSYHTYDEAKRKISEINDRFPDAWVLVQKK